MSIFAEVQRIGAAASTARMSTISSPSRWPPLSRTAPGPSAKRSAAASAIRSKPGGPQSSRTPASGRFGVTTAAMGSSVSRRMATASGSSRRAPPLATITGSTTSGIPGARSRIALATASMTGRLCSMPVFMASTPRSPTTTSICCLIKSGSIPTTPWTPSVFWAVSAVTAVIAKPPSAVTVLMSACIPAPPPESDPATIRTRPFTGQPPRWRRRRTRPPPRPGSRRRLPPSRGSPVRCPTCG